jgi:hypothetical protein
MMSSFFNQTQQPGESIIPTVRFCSQYIASGVASVSISSSRLYGSFWTTTEQLQLYVSIYIYFVHGLEKTYSGVVRVALLRTTRIR